MGSLQISIECSLRSISWFFAFNPTTTTMRTSGMILRKRGVANDTPHARDNLMAYCNPPTHNSESILISPSPRSRSQVKREGEFRKRS